MIPLFYFYFYFYLFGNVVDDLLGIVDEFWHKGSNGHGFPSLIFVHSLPAPVGFAKWDVQRKRSANLVFRFGQVIANLDIRSLKSKRLPIAQIILQRRQTLQAK